MVYSEAISKHARLAALNRALIPCYIKFIQGLAQQPSTEAEHQLIDIASNPNRKKIADHGHKVPLLVNARAIAAYKLLEIVQQVPLTEDDLSKLIDLVTNDRYFPITHRIWKDDKENNAVLRSEAALIIAKFSSSSELYKKELPNFVKSLIRILNDMTKDVLYKESKPYYLSGGRTFVGALYLAVKDLKNVYVYNEPSEVQDYEKEISKFMTKFSTTREDLLMSLNIKE